MDTLSDRTAAHPVPGARDGELLDAAGLDATVCASELVDVVDEAAVAAVATAVTDATEALALRPAEHREDVATRSPVDLEVIIPAYNESGRLPATLTAMVAFLSDQPWSSRVVVVDNGSVDDTAAAVLSVTGAPARPTRAGEVGDALSACSPDSLTSTYGPAASSRRAGSVEAVAIGCSRAGKGAAVHRGLRTSRSRWVGFTDADLSTPLETFLPALEALSGGAAAAIASRHAPGAQLAVAQPLGRRLGGGVFRMFARGLLPGVADTQCGFKMFDRVAVQSALWRSRSVGFAFDVELLRHIRDDGGRIVEIPVTWTDTTGSTLRPIRDGVAAFTAVAKLHRDLGRRVAAPTRQPIPARSLP